MVETAILMMEGDLEVGLIMDDEVELGSIILQYPQSDPAYGRR